MNMTKKQIGIMAVIFSVALLAGLFIGIQNNAVASKTVYITTHGIAQDTVTVVERNAQGQIVYTYEGHNLLTTEGSSYLIGAMSNTTNDGATTKAVYMTCSTNSTTPAVTWTSYGANNEQGTTQGLGRTAALTPTYGLCTTASGTSTYFTVTNTWTANGTVSAIVALGLNWKATANSTDLIAVAAITSASVVSGDTLQGTWNVTVPCG